MDPIIGGLITGGASLLGSIFGSHTSGENTERQIQASMAQQANQNAFTERMSSTAYQRASADMRAAGLNPAMMFGSGSAASTPAGSGIQAPMPQNRSPMAGLGDAANQVVSTAINAKTFDKMTEEIANLRNQQALSAATTELRKQELETERSESLRRANLAEQEGLKLPGSRFTAKENEARLSMDPDYVKAAVKGSYYGSKASDVLAPVGHIVGTARAARMLFPRRSTTETTRSGDDSFTERFNY